jgi:hypothetical protein
MKAKGIVRMKAWEVFRHTEDYSTRFAALNVLVANWIICVASGKEGVGKKKS